MRFENLRERWTRTAGGFQICRFALFIVSSLLVFMTAALLKNLNREKIILLPPAIYQKAFITADNASPEYVRRMVDYILYLVTNYTPETVNKRLQEFLKYVEPSVRERLKKQIEKIAEDTKYYSKTQAFYPKKFDIDTKNRRVTVEGKLLKFYMGQLLEQKDVSFTITYTVRNGEFLITSLELREMKRNKGENK